MIVKVFYGPDNAFKEFMSETTFSTMNDIMLQVIEIDRSFTVRSEDSEIKPKGFFYETIVCYRQEYSSMSINSINNIMLLLRNVRFSTLYFQNPPNNIIEVIRRNFDVDFSYYEYGKIGVQSLIKFKGLFQDNLMGQERALNVLLPVLNIPRVRSSQKPIVLMFYGPPGVGKTETAKLISQAIYGSNKIKRFQLSMFQTDQAYKFLFGSKPQEDSLAKSLLSRETNVILFDEFDKVHPNLYSAFYELFDEGQIVDGNYTAKVDNAIFICTSNYLTTSEIEKNVGGAIFSRITECIKFEPLNEKDKLKIITTEFKRSFENLAPEDKEKLSHLEEEMLLELSSDVDEYMNTRDIKNSVDMYLSYKLLRELNVL
mgnify:CR=1 FL=1